jgi:hypothetical protein
LQNRPRFFFLHASKQAIARRNNYRTFIFDHIRTTGRRELNLPPLMQLKDRVPRFLAEDVCRDDEK